MPDTPLPHDLDVEEIVLGCAILSQSTAEALVANADESYFYDPAPRDVFLCLTRMVEAGSPVELASVLLATRDADVLDRIGGQKYLLHLAKRSPTAASFPHYFKVLCSLKLRRDVISHAQRLEHAAREPGTDGEELLADLEATACSLAHTEARGATFAPLTAPEPSEWRSSLLGRLRPSRESPVIWSPWPSIDRYTGGFRRGEFVLLAGRPSTGKTTFAVQAAIHAARYGKRCAFVSAEMTPDALRDLALAHTGPCSRRTFRLREGVSEAEAESTMAMADALMAANLPIVLSSPQCVSAPLLFREIRRLHARERIDLLIIDYLQLLRPARGPKNQNRERDVAGLSADIKQLVLELNMCSLVLSQLSRESDKFDRAPRLSDLRESGALEQDADIVMMLYGGPVPKSDEQPEPPEKDVVCYIRKGRSSGTGRALLRLKGEMAVFTEPGQEV